MWDLDLVADLAAAGLRRHAGALDDEQAVRGIDALAELRLHEILRDGLGAEQPDGSRFPVLAEQRYPGDRSRPRRSEGERCDIVLLPAADGGTPGLSRRGQAPDDTPDPDSPWRRRLLDPLEAGTLFEGFGVAPEEALWIEVKVAAQFALIEGVARASPRYSTVMLREVPRDARKLAADPVIRDGAVLVVMFNADEATAAHDVEAWRVRGMEKKWPIRSARVRRFAINDRIGNGVAGVLVCGTV